MGPGAGSISGALIRHPTLFRGLGMGPALSGLGFGIYLADLARARSEGFGNDVQAYRNAVADRIATQIVIPFSTLIMSVHNEQTLDLPSSGGGGPGGLPNLHQPPPSIEETGEILSNPSIAGEVRSDFSPTKPTSRERCPFHRHRNPRTGGNTWSKGVKGPRCVKYRGHGGRHAATWYNKMVSSADWY